MSLSNPKLINPCSKFIEFKGDKGVFQYWDRELENNVQLFPPCYFIILDELTTIKGYSNQNDSGIYSNEIHDITKETLRVKSFKGNLSITGLYNDIKSDVKAQGGKYCKSVYAMMFDDKGARELVNFQFTGAALAAYFDKKFVAERDVVGIMNETLEKKNGSILYKEPVFKHFKMNHDLMPDAIEMDKQLQGYLNQYKKNLNTEVAEAEGATDIDIVNQEMDAAAREAQESQGIDTIPPNITCAEDSDELPY